MEHVIQILYYIISLLKLPVIITLLIMFVWSLYESGIFIREKIERSKTKKEWKNFINIINCDGNEKGDLVISFFNLKKYPGFVTIFAKNGQSYQNNPARLEKLITDIELEVRKRCTRYLLGIRIAPMLGLIGTLIPMGPALMGLSTGDLDSLSRNLFVAFSTTVIGLLIGAASYLIYNSKKQWYTQDLIDIEYLFIHLFEDHQTYQ
jgi:biopolymer transport protein ExbB/TolQ